MTDLSPLPPATDSRWRELITGHICGPWKNLALKMMLARLETITKDDPSSATINKAVNDVRTFFEKNRQGTQDDLRTIFKK